MAFYIKKESMDQSDIKINPSKIPCKTVEATLEIPGASSLDFAAGSVKIVSTKGSVDLESVKNKQYEIILGNYCNNVVISDIRQKGLDQKGQEIEIAAYNLNLKFRDGSEMVKFCNILNENGCTCRSKKKK